MMMRHTLRSSEYNRRSEMMDLERARMLMLTIVSMVMPLNWSTQLDSIVLQAVAVGLSNSLAVRAARSNSQFERSLSTPNCSNRPATAAVHNSTRTTRCRHSETIDRIGTAENTNHSRQDFAATPILMGSVLTALRPLLKRMWTVTPTSTDPSS